MAPHRRLPISARHAFALAFDLAVRRDPRQSLLVPVLLHAPWLVATAMLRFPEDPSGYTRPLMAVQLGLALGETLTWLTIGGMLRFRARSVFNTPAGRAPAPLGECYSRGFRRAFWLYATELVRYLVISLGFLFLFFPGVWIAFRLSMATEAVVLRERNTARALAYSFKVTDGRLERWLEMIVGSVALLLAVPMLCAVGFLMTPDTQWSTWVSLSLLLSVPAMSVVQYAWTFFFLRLEEIDLPRLVDLPSPVPFPAAAERQDHEDPAAPEPSGDPVGERSMSPRLTVVEGTGKRPEDGR